VFLYLVTFIKHLHLTCNTQHVKIYLKDIVHALTMRIIRRLQAKIGNSLPHNVVYVGYVDYYYSRVRSGCIIVCPRRLHFRNNLQPAATGSKQRISERTQTCFNTDKEAMCLRG